MKGEKLNHAAFQLSGENLDVKDFSQGDFTKVRLNLLRSRVVSFNYSFDWGGGAVARTHFGSYRLGKYSKVLPLGKTSLGMTLTSKSESVCFVEVGDYESARKYLAGYLAERDSQSMAHKLNGKSFFVSVVFIFFN